MPKLLLTTLLFLQLHTLVYATIKIEGSTTIGPLISKIEKIYPHYKLSIKYGGSGAGLKALRMGQCDIAMVSRELTPKELKDGFIPHLIAYDGIAIIVNPSVEIDTISSEEIIKIYRGEINNLKNSYNQDEPITVVSKAPGSGTFKIFNAYFKIDNIRKDALDVGSNLEDIIFVASQPVSIGFASIGSVLSAKEKGAAIKLLKLDGIAPTIDNIVAQKYKLSRKLYLVTYKKTSQKSKDFIRFVRSPQGQAQVRLENFTGIQ